MNDFLQGSLPFWGKLSDEERELLTREAIMRKYSAGTIFYHSGKECEGAKIVKKGRARVYISSPDGREITLYRIFDNDFCTISIVCMISNVSLEISLETETACEIALIPHSIYKRLLDKNAAVKDFSMELVSSKFVNIMRILEQIVFSNVGRRLAGVLIEQSVLSGSLTLEITHEKIASDLGTAREVVTRLLKKFQLDGLITLSRGRIKIVNQKALREAGNPPVGAY